MPKKPSALVIAPEVKAWRETIKPLKRLGISLYDQQLWCWGYDIRQQGNLLLRYGFAQYRQDKSCGGTAYTVHLPENAVLRLWGGSLVYHDRTLGALHLKRYEFEPRLMPVQYELSYATPENSTIPQNADECLMAARLAARCMCWTAEYERWVVETAGLAHREASVQPWKQNTVFPIAPSEMSALWDECAAAIEIYAAARVSTLECCSI
jgi:hypothetical protein